MKKKSFIRVLGMMLLLMMCSVALSAQPRAIISDHLEPAVLVNPGDTLKAEVLNYLNEKGPNDWKSRGFVYVKNGGFIYVDMRRLSQFDHWEYQKDSPIVKIAPVLDPRGSTRKTFHYIDKSGNEQELQLEVIPYNVPMLHSKDAVYELDPRSAAALPASLTELKMAREQINAFYEYRITDDRQLNDYITVQDPAEGQTGIDKLDMTIDYRMPTPEAPYNMREFGVLGGGYDFDKGVSIAQLRAISQRYPHTEASDLDPNAHGIDSLDFTVCIASGSIAWSSSRHFSYTSGGGRYYTYIRVIDQRRRSLSLEPNISLVGYKYTPLNIPFASASRVEVRANGRPLNESKFSIRDKVNLSFNIQNDPNNMYHFYRIATKSGRLIYQYGETSLNGQSSNTVYQKLSTDFTVSGEDDVFLVTLCRWKSSFTVQSNDPSLGQAFFVDQENYPYSSVRGGGRNRLVLAEGEYFYPILKPSDNVIFRGWRIGNSDKILTTIGDLTPYFTIGTQNFVEKENDYLWTLLNPNNEDVVDLSLTAVFEAAVKPVKKSTLMVGVSAKESGSVSINGETQTSITVDQGTEVILEAQANKGYVFSHWKNSEGTQVETTAKLNYKVEKDETLTAVFVANTPGVDEVTVLTGQRDAILTWDAGSATSWQIKLYQADQILGDPIVTQVPRVELGNLSPGREYRYEIIAKAQGKLDSEAKKATFMTEKFNEAEAITPYLKGFSLFRGGQAFDLIWMDVNPTEFVSETPIYRYYWQATPNSELVLLTPSGKQLTLDANRRGGRLIVRILSGNDQLYEIGYDLN